MNNLSFESGTGGAATSWTLSWLSSLYELAEYSSLPFENFEQDWSTNETADFEFAPGDLSAALYAAADLPAPIPRENFEQGWTNTSYFFVSFPTTTGGVEDFSWITLWSVLGDVSTDVAQYDADVGTNGYENFETAWLENEDFADDWADITPSAAVWSGELAAAAEIFEQKDYLVYTADILTNELTTAVNHGLAADYTVRILPAIGGAVPGPLVQNLMIYRVYGPSITADTLQLQTPNGTLITLTSAGSGELRFDTPKEYWSTLMSTI